MEIVTKKVYVYKKDCVFKTKFVASWVKVGEKVYIMPCNYMKFKKMLQRGWEDLDKWGLFTLIKDGQLISSEVYKKYRTILNGVSRERKKVNPEVYQRSVERARKKIRGKREKINNKKNEILKRLPEANKILEDFKMKIEFKNNQLRVRWVI